VIGETIIIGSDPWAGRLHGHLADKLRRDGHEVAEVNDSADSRIPYYEIARRLAVEVSQRGGPQDAERRVIGIVLCGTGMGVAMVANTFPGISCAVCENSLAAHRARAFNNANVLALGEYFTTPYVADEIVDCFLTTPFGDGVDADRAAEIRRWGEQVRRMEDRIFREDWAARSVPDAVPPVETAGDRA